MFTATAKVLRAVPSLDPTTVKKANLRHYVSSSDTESFHEVQHDAPADKLFYRGRNFRLACAVTTAAPVLAATSVVLDVVRPAVSGASRLAYAVAGPAAGIVGSGLGAIVGTLFGLAPVAGGVAGYRVGRCAVSEVLKFAATALIWTTKLLAAVLVTLAAYLGYAVGSVVTSPLFLLGKRPAA